MNSQLRRRFEMAVRVRDFLHTHPTTEATEKPALARLEELIARADALASQQRAGVVARRASTEQRAGVRESIQRELLRYLGGLGQVVGDQNPELATEFRVPRKRANNQAFLTMVKGMLEKATAMKDQLVSLGMSPALLDDIAKGIADFEKTLEATRAGLLEHVGASADLQTVASEISKVVRLLDGLVRYHYRDNAELLAAWASARDVLGPFHANAKPDAGGGTAPSAGGGEAPAITAPAA